jgi:protein-S-isoprenylcysteine O-methyltransferase Ste14
MMLRAILAFLILPTFVAGVFPWLISMIPALELPRWTAPIGMPFIFVGSAILIASVISFYRRGRGTLAPWDPPKHLVVQDIYRFNRNPMYVGITVLLFGWSFVTGNPWNFAYAALIPVIFHLRVVLYEEKEMKRLFGAEWDTYCKTVPRWGFRFRP